MNQRLVSAGLIVSLMLNLVFAGAMLYWRILAPKKMWRPRSGVVLRHPFPMKEHNLTEEQRRALDRIREAFSPRIDTIRRGLFEERNKLAALITSAKPDTTMIKAQIEQIGKHQIDLEKAVVQQILREKDLLDPAQRELFIGGILHRMMGPQHRLVFPPPPPPDRQTKDDWKEKTPSEGRP